MDTFRFQCKGCDQWHDGMPTFGAFAPDYYFSIPENERDNRCELTSDTCIVDDKFFFIRGCVEIPVIGTQEKFIWGLWVSISKDNFLILMDHYEDDDRAKFGPMFGWLSVNLETYPECETLKTHVHIREPGMRPFIELEPSDHPLSAEQQHGISIDRVAEIYAVYGH